VEPQLVEELQVEELGLSEEFGEQVLRLVAEQAWQPEVGQVLAEQALAEQVLAEQALAEQALAELVLLGRH